VTKETALGAHNSPGRECGGLVVQVRLAKQNNRHDSFEESVFGQKGFLGRDATEHQRCWVRDLLWEMDASL
jgi:hypothetical protein